MGRVFLAIIVASGLSLVAASHARAGHVHTASFSPVGTATAMPYGWYDFCRRYPKDCESGPLPAEDFNLTTAAWAQLERINRQVNRTIEPLSDIDHWGVLDQWDYPADGKGDCEDYALLKRKILLEQGFPRQALLVTVVRDQRGEGHAVLDVKTNHGEFILDNQRDEILAWDATGYLFVKRQSQEDPNRWVGMGENGPGPLTTAR
jgi:predicted transglutaminase-like cysteine proteinase